MDNNTVNYLFLFFILANSIQILCIWKSLLRHSKTDMNTLNIMRKSNDVDYGWKIRQEILNLNLSLISLSIINGDGSYSEYLEKASNQIDVLEKILKDHDEESKKTDN